MSVQLSTNIATSNLNMAEKHTLIFESPFQLATIFQRGGTKSSIDTVSLISHQHIQLLIRNTH